MLYIGFVIAITALTVWLHRARAAPSLMFFSVMVMTAIGLQMLLILTPLGPEFTWSFGASDPTFTVYRTQTDAPSLLSILLMLASLPLTLWIQERVGAMYHPRLTRWMIWPPIVVLLHSIAGYILLDGLFGASSETLRSFVSLFAALGPVAPFTFFALYGLAVWCFLRRALDALQ